MSDREPEGQAAAEAAEAEPQELSDVPATGAKDVSTGPKEGAKEVSTGSKEGAEEGSNDAPKCGTKEGSNGAAKEGAKEGSNDAPKGGAEEGSNGAAEEGAKDPKDEDAADQEMPDADKSKDVAKATGEDGGTVDEKKGESEKEERRKGRRERKEEKRDRRDKSKSDRKDGERDRDRGRDRDRKKRSRSRSRDRHRERSRRGRDSLSRSRSRDRYRDKDRRRRSRSRSRDNRRRRSRSHDRRDSRRRDDRRDRRRGSSSSSDEYGGYVPRKRHGDRVRSSRDGAPYGGSRTSPMFDRAPAVVQRPSMQIPPVVDPAEALRKLQEQQLQARQLVLQQQAASAAAAATKTQREVYVGNLTVGLVTEEVLRTLFNNALQASFPASATPGMEPVVSVNIHSDGRYAFVEMRSPEMATEALKLSGLQLLGQALSVGRPSGYVDPAIAAQQAAQAAAALQAFQQAAQGGAGATVALPGAVPAIMPATALIPPGPPPLPGLTAIPAVPGAAAPAAAPVAAGAAEPAAPTAIICVDKMFTEGVMGDDEEYVEVMQDLQEECGKSGNVVDIKVPRPSDPSMVGQGDFGKAFVQFSTPEQAMAVKELLHGRSFDGQVLNVTFIPCMPTA